MSFFGNEGIRLNYRAQIERGLHARLMLRGKKEKNTTVRIYSYI